MWTSVHRPLRSTALHSLITGGVSEQGRPCFNHRESKSLTAFPSAEPVCLGGEMFWSFVIYTPRSQCNQKKTIQDFWQVGFVSTAVTVKDEGYIEYSGYINYFEYINLLVCECVSVWVCECVSVWYLKRILNYLILQPCIQPRPDGPRLFYASRAGLRANFHIIIQTRARPRACFRLLLIFIY